MGVTSCSTYAASQAWVLEIRPGCRTGFAACDADNGPYLLFGKMGEEVSVECPVSGWHGQDSHTRARGEFVLPVPAHSGVRIAAPDRRCRRCCRAHLAGAAVPARIRCHP